MMNFLNGHTKLLESLLKHGAWFAAAAVLFFTGILPLVETQKLSLERQADSYKVLADTSAKTLDILQDIKREQQVASEQLRVLTGEVKKAGQ